MMLSGAMNCCLLELLIKVGVQFKPTKCTFFAKELQVLGHTITEHNSKGVEAITSMELP